LYIYPSTIGDNGGDYSSTIEGLSIKRLMPLVILWFIKPANYSLMMLFHHYPGQASSEAT
jgi:hypothetical protein